MRTISIFIKIILIITGMNVLLSCLDPIRDKNRKKYTPEFCFEEACLPLGRAIYKGDTREAERLIREKKIDINALSSKSGFRFLYYACLMEDLPMVKKLLQLGADPNKISIDKTGKRKGIRETNISFTVARGNLKLTKLLLENGANPNTPVGSLPLNVAMTHDNMQDYLNLLFKYGADANYPEYGDGKNSAQIALLGRHFQLIHYFLDKGADPLLLDMDGNSLAFSIQEELAEFRGTEKAKKELESVRERLQNEYKIQFPIKADYRKGAMLDIKRYEQLPREIKDLSGMESDAKFIQKIKDSLALGKTYWGIDIEEVDQMTKVK
ncbi:ankyrin repeat domain-containing protein [Apibacter sp. HY039]|uniref:ankyrin repeat domain-containing protein n=1 Tax=Apibacter sp. HY039 TaxID=2501476 RepID=UPI000FEBAB4E|nr:ankyrin repeat domain-containing protein [Apibacter sp. HY039]